MYEVGVWSTVRVNGKICARDRSQVAERRLRPELGLASSATCSIPLDAGIHSVRAECRVRVEPEEEWPNEENGIWHIHVVEY